MEEKILIKSKNYNVIKRMFIIALIISLLCYFISFSVVPLRFFDEMDYYPTLVEIWEKELENPYSEDLYYRAIETVSELKDEGPLMYAIRMEGGTEFMRLLIFFGGPQLIVGIIFLWLKSYELIITDKRAYGRTAFGKRVDLPIDSISSLGLGWLKSIKISTASGKISFLLIKNRDEMYEEISKIIVERQRSKTKSGTVIKQEVPQSNADELKKYKDLLDSGVITEEEFEAKKKQLLGL